MTGFEKVFPPVGGLFFQHFLLESAEIKYPKNPVNPV
jgi:hypothetical protein